MCRGGWRSVLAAALLLSGAAVEPAQGQGAAAQIFGVVMDRTNAVLPGVHITVTNIETGVQRRAVSGHAGRYAVLQLPPGTYEMTFHREGFRPLGRWGIHLEVNQKARIDATMAVGTLATSILVLADTDLKDPESASLTQTIPRRAIRDLPLNGRNYLRLGSLSAGVTPQIPPSQGPASFIGATTQRPGRSILVGGNRESSTSYLLDGVEIRNPRVGDTSLNPSLDAIHEFKIQRNFFSAEFGFAPAVVNIASRSGTNQWHGSAYEFLRNNRFDARNFFAKEPEPFKRNQFGFSAGGPLAENAVFIFGSYEGLRQRLGAVQRGRFPTTTMLSGDFTGQNTIHDPLSFDADAGTRDPFPNNVIPASRINRVSRNFFPFIPETDRPTVNGANLTGNPVEKLDDDQFHVRSDWIASPRHSLFGRVSWQDAPLSPASLAPLGGRQVIYKGTNETVQLTSTVSPRLVNHLRLSHHYAELFGQHVPVDRNLAAEIGVTGVSRVPRNFGVPAVAWQGFDSIGSDGLTQGSIMNRYEVSDTVSMIRGPHRIKFGGNLRQARLFLDSDNSPRGNFSFSPAWTAALGASGGPAPGTGHSVADFLLGFPQSQSGAAGTTQTHFRFWQSSLYIQDDWKLRPDLTLNLGLRWEYTSPPRAEELGNISAFNFAADGSSNAGLQKFPLLGQVRETVVTRDLTNFAPRVGLAWNPSFAKSWAFRAGAGVYYDQTQMNELQFMTNSPPGFRQQNQVFEGRGLPKAEFGVNALPEVAIAPVSPGFETPQGSFLFAIEEDGAKPREYMWTFSVQKSVGDEWLAEAAYVGLQGRRLSKRFNADAAATPGVLQDVTPGVRRFPGISGVLFSSRSGKSQFHALNLKLERRFAKGFSVLAAFNWGHSIDTDSGGSFGTPNLNPANFQLDRGSSDFDIRRRFTASAIYELPLGKDRRYLRNASGLLNAVVGGWQLNTITVFQTGVQRSVTAPNRTTIPFISQRADHTGVNPDAPFQTADARTIRPGEDFSGTNPELFQLNPAAFAEPGPLRFGTSGRNIIAGPGFWNADLSLFKTASLTEQTTLQFRAEFFNAFNNVRFDPPNLNAGDPRFGRILSAQAPRIIQFGLRLEF